MYYPYNPTATASSSTGTNSSDHVRNHISDHVSEHVRTLAHMVGIDAVVTFGDQMLCRAAVTETAVTKTAVSAGWHVTHATRIAVVKPFHICTCVRTVTTN
jgi:hypothetical protein